MSATLPMTTANKITVIRILMIPVFVTLAIYYGAKHPGRQPAGLATLRRDRGLSPRGRQ